MNRIIIIGNNVTDIELRKTNSGKSVCQFTVADNSIKDKPVFIDVQAWEKTAEVCANYLKKGHKVAVEGTLAVDTYETERGKGKKTYVKCTHVELIQPKENTQNVSIPSDGVMTSPNSFRVVDLNEDDLPF